MRVLIGKRTYRRNYLNTFGSILSSKNIYYNAAAAAAASKGAIARFLLPCLHCLNGMYIGSIEYGLR